MPNPVAWDWSFAARTLPKILGSLGTTLWVTVLSGVLAVAVGLVLTALAEAGSFVSRAGVRVLVELLRGCPLPIQLYFAFYGLPEYGIVWSGFTTGVVVLGLHYGAYVSEVFRGAIADVRRAHLLTCDALGLGIVARWRRIIVPLVFKFGTAPVGSYMITIYKQTAYLFIIGVPVIMSTAKLEGSKHFRYIEAYTIVGAIYLVVALSATAIVRRVECRGASSFGT
ncbi:MAG: amino acid ABC transporter permease [Ilumatobacteraceae bacterium]